MCVWLCFAEEQGSSDRVKIEGEGSSTLCPRLPPASLHLLSNKDLL